MFLEIAAAILLFAVGYLLGRIRKLEIGLSALKQNYSPTETTQQKDVSRVQYTGSNPTILPKVVEIDERKFVTNVTTESFTKTFDELGETTTEEDDISQSISKLSQLKNKRK